MKNPISISLIMSDLYRLINAHLIFYTDNYSSLERPRINHS